MKTNLLGLLAEANLSPLRLGSLDETTVGPLRLTLSDGFILSPDDGSSFRNLAVDKENVQEYVSV